MPHFQHPALTSWPKTKAEVEAMSVDDMLAFMDLCDEEPADPDACMACYALIYYTDRETALLERQVRENLVRKITRVIVEQEWYSEPAWGIDEFGNEYTHPLTLTDEDVKPVAEKIIDALQEEQ